MQIGNLLKRLLNEHARVSVPGIGMFQKKRIPARFDAESNEFLPPSYSYELLPQTGTDSHLLEYFLHHTTVSEDAQEKLNATIASLLQELEENGQASLEPIGFLHRENGIYMLSPNKQYWGLKPVEEAPVQEQKKEETEENTIDPEFPEALPIPETEENDHSHEKEEANVHEETDTVADGEAVGRLKIQEHKENKWKKIAIWSFIIIVAGLICAYAVIRVRKDHDIYNSFLVRDTTEADPEEEPLEIPVITTDAPLQAKSDSLTRTADDTVKTIQPESAKPYHIIIGSLPSIKLANQQVEHLKTKGINASVLQSNMPGNRKKISYGTYATYEEAAADLESVRKNVNKEAYIFPDKK